MSKTYFDVNYETNSYGKVGEVLKLNASYIDNDKCINDLSWSSENDNIASVDNLGNVTLNNIGNTHIIVKEPKGETFRFLITVLDNNISKELDFILRNHHSNALTVYHLGIGAGKPHYYYDVVGSINNIIFDDLKIDYTYHDKLGLNVKNNGLMDKVEFICVHYTGNMNPGADADNNCSYFNNLEYAASIHYVTGRSNLYTDWNEDEYYAFAGLSEKYAGWHASDTKQGPHIWLKTNVKCLDKSIKPIISINELSHFTINGIDTLINIPDRDDEIIVKGPTFDFNGTTCSAINKQGIAYMVKDGEYYLGNTWWGHQQYGKTLCNIGGNYNSIGIESCVDIGSNLMHTWHVTAQLVAHLMNKYNLDIDRVGGHHYFSGKDCPQPFLANDQQLWKEFIKMVEAEYERLTTYRDLEFNLEVNNSCGILNKQGLLNQNKDASLVEYKIKVGKEEVILGTCVESLLKNDYEGDMPSLQQQNYDIR